LEDAKNKYYYTIKELIAIMKSADQTKYIRKNSNYIITSSMNTFKNNMNKKTGKRSIGNILLDFTTQLLIAIGNLANENNKVNNI